MGGNVYEELAQIMLCDVRVIYVTYVNKLYFLSGRERSSATRIPQQKCLSEACISRLLTLAITKSKERKSKNVCRQTYSFLEVKLRHLRRNTRINMISVIGNNILYLSTVLIKAEPGTQYRMQVSNMFMVYYKNSNLQKKMRGPHVR